MAQYSSQEEPERDGLANGQDEVFGTPPTRLERLHSRGSRNGRSHSKKGKRLSGETGDNGRRARQAAHRARPDKHRKQARAFKELDTTLQVLGIDGGQGDKRGLRITASVHAPVQPEPVRTPRRQSSRASLAEEELSDASISSATSLRQRRRRSRGALYRGATFPQPNGDSQLRSRRSQLEAVPSGKQLLVPAAGPPAWQGLHPHSRPDRAQRTPSAEMQPPLESPPRRCLSMPQVSSAEDASARVSTLPSPHSEQELGELQHRREEWQARLSEVVEGTREEDLTLQMEQARSRAEDLRAQLLEFQAPREESRQQMVDWLKSAAGEAKQVFAWLDSHKESMEAGGRMHEFLDILWIVLPQFKSLCCTAVDVVAEGMRAAGQAVTSAHFAAAQETVHIMTRLQLRVRMVLPEGYTKADALLHEMGQAALQTALAGIDATEAQQAQVLSAESLKLGSVGVHETSEHVKQLQLSWAECERLVDACCKHWPHLAVRLRSHWCLLFALAAEQAEAMQAVVPMHDDSESEAERDESSITSGVWGRHSSAPSADSSTLPSVSDEDLQAQAWLPTVMSALLRHADKASASLAELDSGLAPSDDGCNLWETEDVPEPKDVLAHTGSAFFALMLKGTHRVAHLCKAPQLLACWALELLEEQAVNAILCVRELDHASCLRHQLDDTENFERLKSATDGLVNSILRLRQLLKRRRQEPDATERRPTPRISFRPAMEATRQMGWPGTALAAGGGPARGGVGRSPVLARPQPASQLTASMAPRGQRSALGAEQALRQNIGTVLLPPTVPAAPAPAPRQAGEAGGSPAVARQPTPSSGPNSAPRQPRDALGAPAGARQRPPKAPASPAGRRTLQAAIREAAQQPSEDAQASPTGPESGVTQQHAHAGPAKPAADTQATPPPHAQGGSWTQVVGQRGPAPAAALRPPTQSRRNLQQQQHPDARLPMRDTQPQGGAAQATGQHQPGGRQFKRHRSRGRGGHRSDGPAVAPFSHQVAVVSHSHQQRGTAATSRAGPSRGALTGAIGSPQLVSQAPIGQPPPQPVPARVLPSPYADSSLQDMAVQEEAAGSAGQAQTAPEAEPPDDKLPTREEQQHAGAAAAPPQQPPPASQQQQQRGSNPQTVPAPPAAAAAPGGAGQSEASPGSAEQSGAAVAASAGPAGGEQSTAQHTASPPPRKAYKDVLASPIASPFQALASISAKNLQPQVVASMQVAAAGPPDLQAEAHGSSSSGTRLPPECSTGGACSTSTGLVDPIDRPTAEVPEEAPSSRAAALPPASRPGTGAAHLPLAALPSGQGPLFLRGHRSDSLTESMADDASSMISVSSMMDAVVSRSDSGLSALWQDDEFWQVRWEDVRETLNRKLGEGSSGQVWVASYFNSLIAVKVVRIDRTDGDSRHSQLARFKQQVDMQRQLRHAHIVAFYGVSQIPRQPGDLGDTKLAILMELCQYGSFFKLIRMARQIKNMKESERIQKQMTAGWKLFTHWEIRLSLAYHVAGAVDYMHCRGLIHRDLTSANLLVGANWQAKVTDFDLSRQALQTEPVPYSGGAPNSPAWSAPERLKGEHYTEKADVFSFGVVLWELTYLAEPWALEEDDGQRRDNFYHVMQSVTSGQRLPLTDDVEPPLPELPQVKELITDCWKTQSNQRPSMAQVAVRLHSILESIRKRKLLPESKR